MNRFWELIIISSLLAIVGILFGYLVSLSPLILPWALLLMMIIIFVTLQRPFYGLIVLIFSMLLSPEIVIANVGGRALTIRIDDIMIIGIFIAWLAHQAFIGDTKIVSKTPLDIPIFIYALLLIVSTALGILRGNVIMQKGFFYVMKYIEYFMIYFVTANIITNIRQVKISLTAGLVTAIIVTLVAYYQIIEGIARTYAPFDTPHGLQGFGEPATLGGYYIIVFAVLMGLITFYKSQNFKYTFILLLLFMLPPFIKTLSRASYLAMAVLYTMIILFSQKKRIMWVIFAVGLIVVSPYLFKNVRQQMENRIMQTFGASMPGDSAGLSVTGKSIDISKLESGNLQLDLSSKARIWAWNYVLKDKLLKRPFIGWGITGIKFLDAQLPLILGETGIFGLFCFIWIMSKILKNSRKAMIESEIPLFKGLGLALLAATIALLAQSMTTNTFIIVRIMEPFWFLTAIVMRIPYLEDKINEKEGTVIASA